MSAIHRVWMYPFSFASLNTSLTFRCVPSSSPSPSCDYRLESWRFKTNASVSFSARPISSGSANVTKFDRFRHLYAPHSIWLCRFASLRFRAKNMAQHIFLFESELQNNFPEAAPSSPSLSPTVSEKLALYGSSALSGVEHLTLLVGKEAVAAALIRHFGSVNALSRASFQQLRQFLPQRKAEAVMAAFSLSMIAESEHARSDVFDNPESVYRSSGDMKLFTQEVLPVVLLNANSV